MKPDPQDHSPRALSRRNETASQTAGPFVHIGLMPQLAGVAGQEHCWGHELVAPGQPGHIRIEGVVYDGSGTPVRDLVVEIWQADPQGHYAHPADSAPSGFRGWARASADFETGLWHFDTLKPGAVQGPHGLSAAPHIALLLLARGINLALHTRLYFEDEASANERDPVLNSIEWTVRRQTLVARRMPQTDGTVVYRLDIHLQHPEPARETVFFDI